MDMEKPELPYTAGGNEPRGSHSESSLAVLQKVTKIEFQSDPAISLLGV